MQAIITKADAGGFEGYGSIFYKLDRHGDIVMPGCFKESLPLFLKEGFVGGVGHQHGAPVGRYTDAYEDAKGLYVTASFSDTPEAKTTRTLIKDRVVQKLSVGFEIAESEMVSKGQVEELWRKARYKPSDDDKRRLKSLKSVRLILKARLLEVSPVTIPSNDEARIMAVKSFEQTPAEFQAFMHTARAAILKLSTVNTKAGRVLSGKNEMKLRAMLEVLSSVSEELNNLLLLVNQAPQVDEEAEAEEEENGTEETAETTVDQAKLAKDEEFAKQRGADKKAALNLQLKAVLMMAEAI